MPPLGLRPLRRHRHPHLLRLRLPLRYASHLLRLLRLLRLRLRLLRLLLRLVLLRLLRVRGKVRG